MLVFMLHPDAFGHQPSLFFYNGWLQTPLEVFSMFYCLVSSRCHACLWRQLTQHLQLMMLLKIFWAWAMKVLACWVSGWIWWTHAWLISSYLISKALYVSRHFLHFTHLQCDNKVIQNWWISWIRFFFHRTAKSDDVACLTWPQSVMQLCILSLILYTYLQMPSSYKHMCLHMVFSVL